MSQVAKVTIDSTQVGSDLTDFPVYIDLADMPASFWSTVANGGGDIRVYKSDGTTELPREVVSCDTSTETGELHVKYSGTLSSTVDTEIQIHADGTSADYAVTDTYGAEAVWTNNKAVYHIEDVNDSTSNSETLTNNNTVAFNTVKIGNGADQGTSNTNKSLSRNDAYGLTPSSERSFAFWVSMNEQPGTGVSWILCRLLFAQSSSNYTDVGYRDTGGTKQIVNNTSPATNTANYTMTTGTPYYVVITHDGDGTTGAIKVYVNGSLQITGNGWINSTYGGTTALYIGADNTGGSPSSAEYDEFRIYDSVLSADWISAEYTNQNTPTTFYTAAAPGISFSITENLSLAESTSNLRTRLFTTSETLSLSETWTALKGLSFSVADTLGLVEAYNYVQSFVFSVADTLGLIEVLAQVKSLWTKTTKNSSSWTDVSKNSSSWTEDTKNGGSWTNINKS